MRNDFISDAIDRNLTLEHIIEIEQKAEGKEHRELFFFGAEFKVLTSLPPELLIVSQRSTFNNQYLDQESSDKMIHKKETYKQFKKRYAELDNNGKEIASYIRIKGNKYAEVIEIQFYVNQLKEEVGESWTPEMENEFIKDVKNTFKLHRLKGEGYKSEGDDIFDLAKLCLSRSQPVLSIK